MQHITIKDLPADERPRERLQYYGAESLSSHELLAIVLGRGVQGESVLVTAQKLLHQFGSLEGILAASLEDLMQMRGLGQAKATQLKACFEIIRRVNNQMVALERIVSTDDVYRLLKTKIVNFNKEHFMVVSFDVRNKVLGVDVVSVGTLDSNLIHPRETFECAIKRHAAKVLIAHNHPSGECIPSEEDIMVTRRLVEAGDVLGIQIVDHLIICQDDYFSFANSGSL